MPLKVTASGWIARRVVFVIWPLPLPWWIPWIVIFVIVILVVVFWIEVRPPARG
jgi:hypothetical protein